MDETIFGKIMAAGILLMVAGALHALWNAKGEGPKRIKQVIGAAMVLAVGAVIFTASGVGGILVTVVLIAVAYWIVRGFMK